MIRARTLLLLLIGLALIAVGPGCSKSDDDAKDKVRRKERRKERRQSRLEKAKVESTTTLVRIMGERLLTYAVTRRQLPRSLDRLVDRKYARPNQLVDPWGARLAYDPGSSGELDGFSLCSNGPDGKAGTGDDICYRHED